MAFELELELIQSHMAQKPVLRGEVGCACVAREVSAERGSMGERGCARRLGGWHFDPALISRLCGAWVSASGGSPPRHHSCGSVASNSTAHKVSIAVDGKAVPFCRCFINSSSLRNRSLSHYKLHSSSTTKQIDVGLFNLGSFHLANEKMADKAGLPEVLRVLDVFLRRLSPAGLGQAREAVRRRTR